MSALDDDCVTTDCCCCITRRLILNPWNGGKVKLEIAATFAHHTNPREDVFFENQIKNHATRWTSCLACLTDSYIV